MRAVRWLVWGVCLGSGAAAVAAGATEAGSGLVAPSWSQAQAPRGEGGGLSLSSFRGRLSLGFNAPAAGMALTAAPPSLISARLLGDYYFGRQESIGGRASGFRATSGVLFGPRLSAWGGSAASGSSAVSVERRSFGLLPGALDAAGRDELGLGGASAVPYVGVGYSDAFDKGRWGISADLGLMALRQQSSGVRLGRSLGAQSVDDALRDLRLAPMLQLGVSYSF